eukprot:TRINITY_DN10268_c0_g1_i1.p1 TRINITY_DN10268_c0_g1~~TRINITY_DN10268_c0_g1_i1.p1  ORF type:complete len:169 (+),score=34.52 TRINITY_DN10268_c0_g1_i1:71-577(+)
MSVNTNITLAASELKLYPDPIPAQLWHTGLCGCFEDCGSCCLFFWCPCCLIGENEALLADRPNTCTDCCCAFMAASNICNAFYMRQHIKTKYGLERGNDCMDCLSVCFCFPCATCQHYREIKYRTRDFQEKTTAHNNAPKVQVMDGKPYYVPPHLYYTPPNQALPIPI